MTKSGDTYFLLMKSRPQVLREPHWFVKKSFPSRMAAEKQYDRYLEAFVSPKDMKIVIEI